MRRKRTFVGLIVLACAWRLGFPAAVSYDYRISYATFFGGSEYEEAREVIPLEDGSVLFSGQTASPDLAVTPGVVQESYAGEPAGTGHPGIYGGDMFVARVSAGGSRTIAATYLGGSKQERSVYGMARDRAGNVVISTATRSSDIPTTAGAYQQTYGGGQADFVVAKLSPDFKRVLCCTYVGSTDIDWARGGLGLDSQDNVYLVGNTRSATFPVTPGAYQTQPQGGNDAVVVKLTADLSRLLFATRVGGSKNEDIMGIRVAPDGTIHVAGHTWSHDFPVVPGAPQPAFGGGESDAFMAGLSADGSRLLYSTYLGGTGAEYGEHRLALLASGAVLFTGVTSSPNFPTTAGAYQRTMRGSNSGYLTKLAPDRASFAFSTLLGGSGTEFYLMPTEDAKGNIIIVGSTSSHDFPVTAGALQRTYGGGGNDAVLAVLSAGGSQLLYATYLGGAGEELIRSVAVGPQGELYVVGKTNSDDFPVTAGAVQTTRGGKYDAFLAKLQPRSQAGSFSFGSVRFSAAETDTAATVTVSRSGGTAGAVSVSYATHDMSATAGMDYTAASGTLSWADGEGGTKAITVPIVDDDLREGTETLTISLSAPTGGAELGSPATAVLSILDDESAGGLIAHWKFDERTGSTASDASGNGLHGRLVNGPVWTASGRIHGALRFNGANSYVQVPDHPALNFGRNQEFTITFWIRGSDHRSIQIILQKRDNTAGFQVWYQPARGFFWRIDEGPNNVETVASTTVLDGSWHHVAVGRSTTEHFVYVDGVRNSVTPDTTLADLTAAISFDIGNESAWPTVGFNGILDDVRVYDRALTAQEIRDLYNPPQRFRRGDANADGSLNVADAVFVLAYLFGGGTAPLCLDAADCNDDGTLDLSDAVRALVHLFGDGLPLSSPFAACGTDPTGDALHCAAFPPCPRSWNFL